MDLFATMLSEKSIVDRYVQKNYGPIPRYRGVRFMKYEAPIVCRNMGNQSDVWAKYCGKDVIYFHTRCGGCGDETDADSNYIACGGKAWEEAHKELFLESVDEESDPTYRDHYFSIIDDDDYKTICKLMDHNELI